MAARRILFAGYAPVHFLCFLPIYRRLSGDSRVELFLSGGFRQGAKGDVTYSLDGFYDPFPVDHDRVIPIERARQEDFDVLVCAHLSDALFPRSAARKVQIFHGVSFKNLAVREKALRYDILCLPGQYHAGLYRRNGLLRSDGSSCLLTGFPKADALVNGELDRTATLEAVGVDPALPTLLFAPTGEKHNALETMGEKVIREIARRSDWNLLVKPHDHPKNEIDWFRELAPHESDRIRIVRDLDVLPFLNAADLLLTDASSVAVEYTLLDRPILFLDVPRLFKRVRKRAPALDLETYGRKIGRIVEDAGDVVPAIAESLAHAEREGEIRREMSHHVFHAPGGATGRTAGVILHAAGLEPELPEGVEVLQPEGVTEVDR